jgi:hypothetical protein
MAGKTKTEAIRQALAERKAARLMDFLARSVWPGVKPSALGRPITKQKEDEILGSGQDGF